MLQPSALMGTQLDGALPSPYLEKIATLASWGLGDGVHGEISYLGDMPERRDDEISCSVCYVLNRPDDVHLYTCSGCGEQHGTVVRTRKPDPPRGPPRKPWSWADYKARRSAGTSA